MADSKISALTASAGVGGSEDIPVNDAGTNKRITPTQIIAYLLGTARTFSKAVHETAVDLGSGTAIDVSLGGLFYRTISGATTFTVSNVPSSGAVASFMLSLTNGGSATITWWSGMRWPSGVAPTLTASGMDVLGFYTRDGGTSWTGLVLGRDVKAPA